MEIKETKYVTFWKPKIERWKDVCKVLECTGIFNYQLMNNYWPFKDDIDWTDKINFN